MSTLRQNRPNATKKALEKWDEETGYTFDKIKELAGQSSLQATYMLSDDLIDVLYKETFKHFETIDYDEDVKDFISVELPQKVNLRSYTYEEVKRSRLTSTLHELITKIDADVKRGDVRASDYPEWTEELRTFIKDEYSHWSSAHDRNGAWAWGRVFNAFFEYWLYSYNEVPFHCYAYQTTQADVLFTRNRHNYDESKGAYDFEFSHAKITPKDNESNNSNESLIDTKGCLIAIVVGAILMIFMLLAL